MKKLQTGGVLCLVLLLAVTTGLAQQAAPTNYRTVQYLKVPADKESAYLDYLRTNARKIVQLRMKSGDVLSWAILKLVYEGSPALEFNYVATTVYAGPPADLSEQEQADLIQHATGMSYQEYQQQIGGLRTSVGSMLGSVEAMVPGTSMQEGNFIAVSRWKIQPMQEAAYDDFLLSTLLPLKVQDFKDGHNLGWTAGRTLYPAGGDSTFDATTATIHKDIASAVKMVTSEEKASRFAKAHPDESYEAFMDRDRAVRRLVRTELVKVMIAEQASQQTSSMPGQPDSGTLAGRP